MASDTLAGRNDLEKLTNLNKKTYKEQVVWFLNSFWEKFSSPADCEQLWVYCERFQDLDPRKKAGNELDEFQAHRFLEISGLTLTVIRMREVLRELDLDFNNKMSLIEFCLSHYKDRSLTVAELVNAPQSARGEIEQAQRLLDTANADLARALARASEARAAEIEASSRSIQARGADDEAQKRLALSRQAENEATAARDAAAAALAELQQQEDNYHGQIKALEARIEGPPQLGVAQLGIAKSQLAQLKQEDPLPLRRAKINQTAAVNKVQRSADAAAKAREASDFAAKQAREAREASDAAHADAVRSRTQADESAAAAEKSLDEATAFMETVKRSASAGKGAMWWMERELAEVRKYLPPKRV